ncbi:MAG: outer membrane beta-barrel protein [Bacteroidetes bacterium]|nr:outer membrane beta-barrel protein [Bacteroidota bacterium]
MSRSIFSSLIFTILILLNFFEPVKAQSNFSFAMGGGIMYYNGDLSDKSYIPPSETIKFFYGADISVMLVDRLDFSARYIKGSVAGDDALSVEKDNKSRNQSFNSKITEVSSTLRLRLFGLRSNKVINPFMMVGLGYFWFNPQAELNGITYDLQPIGTEGQYISGGGYATPYKLKSSSLTLGFGAFFRLADNFALRVEVAPQLTFTDYLDDTSTIYPDSTQLAATPHGSIAVQLSSRRPKGFPNRGRSRGNPNRDDVIITFGASLVYTPPSRNKSHGSKPGVFNQLFKGRKGWWGMTPN